MGHVRSFVPVVLQAYAFFAHDRIVCIYGGYRNEPLAFLVREIGSNDNRTTVIVKKVDTTVLFVGVLGLLNCRFRLLLPSS